LFRSLGSFLNKEPNDVRKEILTSLEKDEEQKNRLSPVVTNLDDYIKKMKEESTWGTENEIVVASKCYTKSIAVMTSKIVHIYTNGAGATISFKTFNNSFNDYNMTLMYDGRHYDVITKTKEEPEKMEIEEKKKIEIPNKIQEKRFRLKIQLNSDQRFIRIQSKSYDHLITGITERFGMKKEEIKSIKQGDTGVCNDVDVDALDYDDVLTVELKKMI